MKKFSRNKAFTLIELLVVISIITLLASIILAAFSSAPAQAKDVARRETAHSVSNALELYYSDNGSYPVSNDTGETIEGLSSSIPMSKYIPAISTDVFNSVNGSDAYVSNGQCYELIYTTQTGRYGGNNGCNSSDLGYIAGSSTGNAACFGQNVMSSSWNGVTPTLVCGNGGGNGSGNGGGNGGGSGGSGGGDGGGGGGGGGGGNGSGGNGGGGGGGGGAMCDSDTVTGSDGLTYDEILAEDGKCWLDRNLGATEAASSVDDTASYGYLYQWGRGIDGHQIITSPVTTTLSTTSTPGNNLFITPIDWWDSFYGNWLNPPDDNLWQVGSGVNNPCPTGFHVPTQTEWSTWLTDAGITNDATAYNSSLKLPRAGDRVFNGGNLNGQGSGGYYWSSSPYNTYAAYGLQISSGSPNLNPIYRAYGFSVRCVSN